MANCNKLFLDFNQNLNVLSTKKTKLSTSKKELRRKITDYFKEHHSAYKPKFFTAHEYATVTALANLIIPKDERSGSASEAGVPVAASDA